MATIRTEQERIDRAATFNEDPALYDRARPTYPAALFEAVWELGGLGTSPNVLEVGCGTGQASIDLARRGARLTCVEFGERMAEWARRKLAGFPSARVVIAKLEDFDPGDAKFDLLFAASCWHWIDPEIRYQKAASLLRTGGSLCIVTSEHCYPEGFDSLYEPIQEVYGEVIGSRKAWPPEPPSYERGQYEDEIDASGLFEPVRSAHIHWSFERTADEYIELLGTFSDNRVLDPEVRERLFSGIHKIIAASPTDRIRKDYLSTVRVAARL